MSKDDEEAHAILQKLANPFEAFSFQGRSAHLLREPKADAKRNLMIFDTETDGRRNCIQLAFIVANADFRPIFKYSEYIKLPQGGSILPRAFAVHKISKKTLDEKGVDPLVAVEIFFLWTHTVKCGPTGEEQNGLIVAHNAAFDCSVMNATAENCGRADLKITANDCFCTMRQATPHCGLLTKNGLPKWPKNSELYEILHGSAPGGVLHDAMEDVRVTLANFQAGRSRGWW